MQGHLALAKLPPKVIHALHDLIKAPNWDVCASRTIMLRLGTQALECYLCSSECYLCSCQSWAAL